jgi:hypothetical protein
MKTAYISCPVSVDMGHLHRVAVHLNKKGFNVKYWNRRSPYSRTDEENIIEADLIVVIPSENTWDWNATRGVASEIKLALNLQKFIGFAYISVGEGLAIYSSHVHADSQFGNGVAIKGVAGTRDSLLKQINPSGYGIPPKTPKTEIPTIPAFDKRLLFLTSK